MYITHFVCHCYLARRNFRLIYCNECPLVWICDEWVKSLSISQPVLHWIPVFTVAGDRWPTVPFRSHSGGRLVSISCLPSSREVEWRHTRAAVNVLLLKKSPINAGLIQMAVELRSQATLRSPTSTCLKAAAVDWDSSHQFVGRWRASFYQSNSQCCH